MRGGEMNRRAGGLRFVLLPVLLSLLAALPGQVARADYNPLAAGTTKIMLDKRFLALLHQNGVELSAAASARLTGGTVVFPVSGGKLDPANGKGTVEHTGTLLLRSSGRRLPLRALVLKTTRRHSPFSAKVGGSQLKLAQAGKLSVTRRGFGSRIEVRALELSQKAATRLGKKLRLRGVFEAGQPLGSSVTGVNPSTVAVRQEGKVALDLDPAFNAKLQSLFVALNPIFPSEHPGAFTFPIFDGALATDASAGRLGTLGALEFLQLGGGQVFWREPNLDFSGQALTAEVEVHPSPPYAGKVGSVQVAALGPAVVSAVPKALTISCTGIGLPLSAAMAATFNEVFARSQGKGDVFLAGESVGTLNFTARGK
jgi:hypothetical protein